MADKQPSSADDMALALNTMVDLTSSAAKRLRSLGHADAEAERMALAVIEMIYRNTFLPAARAAKPGA